MRERIAGVVKCMMVEMLSLAVILNLVNEVPEPLYTL
jgi:hypothetical protein